MSKSLMTKNQPSLTEWFANIGDREESEEFRKEDNEKTERLETLYQTIGVPYERPEKLPARELTDRGPRFQKILDERGDELCAIRLIPTRPGVPKLRSRGLSIRECYETWYQTQNINPDDYSAHICPHTNELNWSVIFVITPELMFGEIIRGLHIQLTRGNTTEKLIQFRYNYTAWQWSDVETEAIRQVKRLLSLLRVSDPNQQQLQEKLNAQFTHNYLCGYFEAVVWPGDKPFIIDYNRVLSKYIPAPPPLTTDDSQPHVLKGVAVSPGNATGPVCIVSPEQINSIDFPDGAILVCDNTDVRYLPLMQKAGAIVTDHGSLLCHAAIVSRELHKPCIVATQIATTTLYDGQEVQIDAHKGIVTQP